MLTPSGHTAIKTYYAVLYANALYLTGDVQAFYAKVGANPANGQVVVRASLAFLESRGATRVWQA